ncbi:SDR family oxidoreductase [Rhodohalobacter sulfatireducens]|uniref:SDR family oxidoreductase n=1 Tax=Rhodohalobacter sulfatireducens TaxID=2911366 RepID=A0ABS9K8L6_9BACT|nr:SDR family oxidoreductase [Rhodohalobacter sulfatireducens]MCG2587152.1 SDR family oxidoreductase [Rhodohalobacter sulfatireducens]
MKITIVGAHGQIAMLLHPILIERGHNVRGIIRKDEQADHLRDFGVEPVIADIEKLDDISGAVGNVDAVLFAAGAGPGSGAVRKWTVDRDGAIKLMEACHKNGIDRYVIISAMGLDKPRGSEVFRVYQKAKAEADEALRHSGLDYTIVKPGRLTDEPGNGKVSIGKNLERGEIPREDVAEVLAEVFDNPQTIEMEFDLVSGDQSISEAISKIINK